MEIIKIKELPLGEYIVVSYEKRERAYRTSYIVQAVNNDKKAVIFWSNSYLTNYITDNNPKRKFKITVTAENRISIADSTKVTLT